MARKAVEFNWTVAAHETAGTATLRVTCGGREARVEVSAR